MSQTRATLIGTIALVLWSTLALLTRLAGPVPPFQMVGMAFLLAALIAFGKWLAFGEPVLPKLRQPLGAWALGLGGLFGYHFFYFLALRMAPPLEANLLNYLWPLLIVLFSALFVKGQHLRLRHLAGTLAGLMGAVVLITKGEGASFDPAYAVGYASAIACGVIWAVYSVANLRYKNVPSDAVGGFCAATSALAFLCAFLFESWVWPTFPQLLAILALGLGPTGAAFFVWDYGCKHGHIRALGALAYAVPLLSNGLLILFGEADLSWPVLVAALLIVGGAALGAGDLVSWKGLFRRRSESRQNAL